MYARSYFGARYLRADLGRFTTIDPVYTWSENLVDPQRWNRYSYVRNNPLRWVDPDGRMPLLPAMAIGALYGAAQSVALNAAINWYLDRPVFEHWQREAALGAAAGATGVGLVKTLDKGLDLLVAARVARAAKSTGGAADDITYLYQKVGAEGEHLNYGITKNPATRYTQEELAGGKLRIVAKGPRKEMLQLERNIHETLPIGPEEAQKFYIQKQVQKGLKPPPYK